MMYNTNKHGQKSYPNMVNFNSSKPRN